MTSVSIRNRTRNTLIAPYVPVFETIKHCNPVYYRNLCAGEGLMLYPAQSADTTGFISPLDIIIISPFMTILATYPSVLPNTVVSPRIHADSHNYAVVELLAGAITDSQTLPGDSIGFYAPLTSMYFTSDPIAAAEDSHA